MNVKDKVAVVTGGASGIGLALCTRFAQEGAHVVLSDLGQADCERMAAPIGAFPVAAHVGREQDIANLVSATIDRFGRSICSSPTPGSPSTAASRHPPRSGRRSSTSTSCPRSSRPST
jgi:NAD(P)-dependent dehydrogenase (short-subunit alcohol dehydrogenase family)